MLLDGRHALITGASSGIGKACAIRFAQEGADVTINYYSDQEADSAQDKIRGLNVAPGAIATPINNFVLDDPEAKHAVEEEIPLARFGQPEEIAAAVAWAASDEAGYMTGNTLVVDGGMSLYPKFI